MWVQKGVCIYQVFAESKKYLAKGKMNFEHLWIWKRQKAYVTIDRYGIWQMLRVYGVGGKLLKVVQSFSVNSIGCVSG